MWPPKWFPKIHNLLHTGTYRWLLCRHTDCEKLPEELPNSQTSQKVYFKRSDMIQSTFIIRLVSVMCECSVSQWTCYTHHYSRQSQQTGPFALVLCHILRYYSFLQNHDLIFKGATSTRERLIVKCGRLNGMDALLINCTLSNLTLFTAASHISLVVMLLFWEVYALVTHVLLINIYSLAIANHSATNVNAL